MSKSEVLYKSLMHFYQQNDHLVQFSRLTAKDSNISLRLLDWLVTNFAKKNNVVYMQEKGDVKSSFNMFMEYKAQLKAYSKKFFDPFCRRERVKVINTEGSDQNTTVAQLNFFKWAITNGVIKYAVDNKDTIELDMLTVSKKKSNNSGNVMDKPKKRRELSSAAIKSCTKTLCHITVRF